MISVRCVMDARDDWLCSRPALAGDAAMLGRPSVEIYMQGFQFVFTAVRKLASYRHLDRDRLIRTERESGQLSGA